MLEIADMVAPVQLTHLQLRCIQTYYIFWIILKILNNISHYANKLHCGLCLRGKCCSLFYWLILLLIFKLFFPLLTSFFHILLNITIMFKTVAKQVEKQHFFQELLVLVLLCCLNCIFCINTVALLLSDNTYDAHFVDVWCVPGVLAESWTTSWMSVLTSLLFRIIDNSELQGEGVGGGDQLVVI